MVINNSNKIIGKFQAVTFDNQLFEFTVNDNNVIYCEDIIKDRGIDLLELKPNFWARLVGYGYFTCDDYARSNGIERALIKSYNISNELLEYLIRERIVRYSTDMAYFYGFDPEYAYDREYQTRAFKYVKDDKKRLVKQKQGNFN